MDDHLKRQSWFGLKRYVKWFLSLSVPNAASVSRRGSFHRSGRAAGQRLPDSRR